MRKVAGDICDTTFEDPFRTWTCSWLDLLKGTRQFCS